MCYQSDRIGLSQSVQTVREEMGDLGESLIDVTQGHGGQGLINLLITGRASPYVWDGIKNVGGLGKHLKYSCVCATPLSVVNRHDMRKNDLFVFNLFCFVLCSYLFTV